MSSSPTLAVVAVLVTLGSLAAPARAQGHDTHGLGPAAGQAPGRPLGQSELALPPQALIDAIVVDEQLGAAVPKDAAFRDHAGRPVTLGAVLAGDLPTLLTFNYSNCPSLCSAQLNGLVDALATSRFALGKQYRLVTIVLAPDEPVAEAGRTRDRYLAKLAKVRALATGVQAGDDRGWTFLVATGPDDDRAIRQVAAAVGFGYRYLATQREYAHPAAVIALSPGGTVTRYVHGVQPTTGELDDTITRAGLSEPSSAAGFLLACLHWDAAANSKRWGRDFLRITVLAFLAIGAIVAGVLVARRRRVPGVNPS